MSEDDKQRWNTRYAAGEYATRTHPTRLLETWIARLQVGRALDVACGAGRNALYLAENGFEVDAVDVSEVALQRAAGTAAERDLHINWMSRDLETEALPDGPYDLIIVSRFLMHRLFPQILDCLAPAGVLVYEQHLRTDGLDLGGAEVGGPKNPAFRLRPQELLHICSELQVMHYFEGVIADPGGTPMALAQLVARARS